MKLSQLRQKNFVQKLKTLTQKSKDHLFHTGGSLNFNLPPRSPRLSRAANELNDTTPLNALRVEPLLLVF